MPRPSIAKSTSQKPAGAQPKFGKNTSRKTSVRKPTTKTGQKGTV